MRRTIAMFLVFSFLGINCRTIESTRTGTKLTPEGKRGASLIVQLKDGTRVSGELIAVKQSSLLLKDSESGIDVNIDIDNVMTIILVKKSKVWLGAGLGLLSGIIIGAITSSRKEQNSWDRWEAGMAGASLMILGLLLGAGIGASAGKDEAIQVEGKSDSEIQEILENLREKARAPDFQ